MEFYNFLGENVCCFSVSRYDVIINKYRRHGKDSGWGFEITINYMGGKCVTASSTNQKTH